MKIKHLQLNTSKLKAPEDIAKFIDSQDIDIASLQEVIYPRSGSNPLKKLVEKMGYHYFEGVHYYYQDKNYKDEELAVCNAVVSKYPIVDFWALYFNSPNYQPKEISEKDFVGSMLLGDEAIVEDMASRGLKYAIKSRAIPITTIKINEHILRCYSVANTVSSYATETEQMYKMAQLLASSLQYSKDIPTILSGDFNVRATSYSIQLLSKYINLHTKECKNTLSDSHRALQKDFPEGLAVDQVFSKGLKHLSTDCLQVDFSDHKALVSEFEIS